MNMNRMLKAIASLALVDCSTCAVSFGLLQLASAEFLCNRMESNAANCGKRDYLEDFATWLNHLVIGVNVVAGLTTLAWITAAYLLGDFGSPTGLRKQGATWWVIAALGAAAAAAFGYYRASLLDALSSNGWVDVVSWSAAIALMAHFFGSVFATPWVVRGQVPGAHWLSGRLHFP
jgi:hypothetical protein